MEKKGKILSYMTEYNPEESVLESLKGKKKGNIVKMKNTSIRDKLLQKNKRASIKRSGTNGTIPKRTRKKRI